MDMVKEHKYRATLAEVLLLVSLLLLAILAITPPLPPMKSNLLVQKSEVRYSVVRQIFIGMDKVASDLKQAKEMSVISSANNQDCIEFTDQYKPNSVYLQYVPVENNKANFYGGLYWSAVQETDFVARPEFPSLSDSTMVVYWKEKEI
jgi:hypothetical protein